MGRSGRRICRSRWHLILNSRSREGARRLSITPTSCGSIRAPSSNDNAIGSTPYNGRHSRTCAYPSYSSSSVVTFSFESSTLPLLPLTTGTTAVLAIRPLLTGVLGTRAPRAARLPVARSRFSRPDVSTGSYRRNQAHTRHFCGCGSRTVRPRVAWRLDLRRALRASASSAAASSSSQHNATV